MKIAIVITGLTSRPGLFTGHQECIQAYEKYLFEGLEDYDVYIVGDTECQFRNMKGFRNVANDTVEIKNYFVHAPWTRYVYEQRFNINNSNLYYKLSIARNMIIESGVNYDCIIKIRSDTILLQPHQEIVKKVCEDPNVQMISTYDFIHIGKPGIMLNYMNIYNSKTNFYFDPSKVFDNTSIFPWRHFVNWMIDPGISKNSAELVISMNILEYIAEHGGVVYMSGLDLRRADIPEWKLESSSMVT